MKKMRMQSTAFAIFAGASLCAANLSADTLGFWDFRDGAPGASVSEVKSSNEKFTGTAGAAEKGGALLPSDVRLRFAGPPHRFQP